MKIAVMSDLHLEFEREVPREAALPEHPYQTVDGIKVTLGPNLTTLQARKPDALVLAGDIDTGIRSYLYARMAHAYLECPVILVPGNHEYYGYRMGYVRELFACEEAYDEPGVYVLDNKAVILDGVRFIGSTMWTDFALFGADDVEGTMTGIRGVMNDYSEIKVGTGADDERVVSPQETRELHLESLRFLQTEMSSEFEGPSVIVTHHAPHPNSLPGNLRKRNVAAAYASDLSTLIRERQPALWLHGHIHHVSDYEVGSTRVVANPRGYFGYALVPEFDPELLIELS